MQNSANFVNSLNLISFLKKHLDCWKRRNGSVSNLYETFFISLTLRDISGETSEFQVNDRFGPAEVPGTSNLRNRFIGSHK